jgi:hypothetical protein
VQRQTTCEPKLQTNKLFWVASMEKWPLQAKYFVDSSALQLQSASSTIVIDWEVLLNLSLNAFANLRNAYSHLRLGNYNT